MTKLKKINSPILFTKLKGENVTSKPRWAYMTFMSKKKTITKKESLYRFERNDRKT